MFHNKTIINSSLLFVYAFFMQFLLLELVFDGTFNNIRKFSHDSIIYHENLLKLKQIIKLENFIFIFFSDLFISYPILFINYIVDFFLTPHRSDIFYSILF